MKTVYLTSEINKIVKPYDKVITNYNTVLFKTDKPNEYLCHGDFYNKGYLTFENNLKDFPNKNNLIKIYEGITFNSKSKFYYEKGISNKILPVITNEIIIDKNCNITNTDLFYIFKELGLIYGEVKIIFNND